MKTFIAFGFLVALANCEWARAASPTCAEPATTTAPSALGEAMTCWAEQKDFNRASFAGEALLKKDPRALKAYFLTSWYQWNLASASSDAASDSHAKRALEILNQAVAVFPTSWQVYVERGDFFMIRLKQLDRAYADYLKGRDYYDQASVEGDPTPPATLGLRASTEDRIAQVVEKLGRPGEAVEATCRALYFDPDDKGALDRLTRLKGSCLRKKVADPRKPKVKEP